MFTAYLCLSSNIGDKGLNLRSVCVILREFGVIILEESGIYETEPWGVKDQAGFLNQIIKVQTDLSPESLICICGEAERQLGRIDSIKWGPRIIDVDVVFYEDRVCDKPNCTIPHYLMHDRRFVLEPLAEIASDFVHPIFGKTVKVLLEECNDDSKVEKIC